MPTLLRPETLTEAVTNHIRNAIISGAFPPGSPLPESRLAADLGTSRGTVREAVRALADDGLVDLEPHKPVMVSTVTLAKASEIYEAREILEPVAVRIGVERGRLTDADYGQEIRNTLDLLRGAVAGKDQAEIVEAERRLHRQMWSACEQETLIDILSVLQTKTRRILVYTRAYDRGQTEVDEHAELVEATLSGDPVRAEVATRDHLIASRQLMVARMERIERGVVDATSGR